MPVQNPFYVYVFVYVQYVCKFELFTVPGCRMSDSGKSSKLDVSSMLLMSMEIAAGLSLGEGKQYNFSYQLQTMVLYDHAHKRLDYINVANIKKLFVLFINSDFAVLMTQGTQKSVCAEVPDMLPVHRLKELVRFDFIHTSWSNPVFCICAIPENIVKRFGQIKFQMISSNEKLVFESGGTLYLRETITLTSVCFVFEL